MEFWIAVYGSMIVAALIWAGVGLAKIAKELKAAREEAVWQADRFFEWWSVQGGLR